MDERRLFARQAFPSMFAYCTAVLHFSEAEAYLRILVARASREHPLLLTMLRDGRLHLTGIGLLVPHLTRQNRDQVLERATHRSKRQIQELVAELAPQADVPGSMRKLPSSELLPSRGEGAIMEPRPDGVGMPSPGPRPVVAAAPAADPARSPALVQPLSPSRYKVQFTASAELHDKLERLRAWVGSGGPDDLAAAIEQAVTEKLERLEAKRFARTNAPRKVLAKIDSSGSGRHIPAAVRRAVSERDGNRCRYADEQGRRCPERDRLQFHHRHPFGLGGDHSVDNIRLMCPAHNAYLADCDYGREAMARHGRPRIGPPKATAG